MVFQWRSGGIYEDCASGRDFILVKSHFPIGGFMFNDAHAQ